MEGMCSHIERSAFADLRLGGRSEHQTNFEMVHPMRRMRQQMKRTMGFDIRIRGMVMNRKLTGQVRGKHSVDCAAMHVIRGSMAMAGLRMDMDQRRRQHPEGKPYEHRAA